ncbi:hypothetical protein [Methylobacterium sp. Leaf125]|uniref:hypothetical protein n=1 Tax=Methylobacterium sp. Leaf125 TaxID=1736265 RepID=UPI000A3D9AC7|nr:hypothetical protein [Methylobacterium sp. Leaf125]
MIKSILNKKYQHLFLMWLDASLTDNERNAFGAKLFSHLRDRGICKHSLFLGASTEEVGPHDGGSDPFSVNMKTTIKQLKEDFAREVSIAVAQALRQAEESYDAKEASYKAREDEQENIIASLRNELSALADDDGATVVTDQDKSASLPETDHVVEARMADEGARLGCFERTMTPEAFCKFAEDIAGRRHWRTALAHLKKVSLRSIKLDLQGAVVPHRLSVVLGSLKPADLKPASRQHWTIEERARLSLLLEEGMTDVVLAHRLSTEFGRRIFEGGVARQRRRLQRDTGRDDTVASRRVRKTVGRAHGGHSAYVAQRPTA